MYENFWQFVFLEYGESDVRCKTPRSETGLCVVIKQCEPLFNLLKKRPIADSTRDYLRQSQCGFSGSDPKVCCPSSGSSGGTGTNTNTGTDTGTDGNSNSGNGKCYFLFFFNFFF